MEFILEVKDLKKVYPDSNFALKDISFAIPYGSIVGFIGENGAGKTTTMGTILGTLKKDGGSIHLFGENIEESKIDIKEDIGVVFDGMNFSGNLNVTQLENVLRHIYQQWDQEKYFHYIDLFSLPRKETINGFSRGMSMKLSIAVALSHDAKLLILDEATAGLDIVAREEILDVLADFVKDHGRAILLSSHIMSDIEKIADQLIFIKKGEIILHVRKDELLQNYAVVTCYPSEFEKIDHRIVVAFQNKLDKIEVLVSDKHQLPPSIQKKNASVDNISLLLMKGEHHERAYI